MSNRSAKFKKYATDARAGRGFDATFLKFSAETGNWSAGKDDAHRDFNNKELLADIGDLMTGWRKFVDDAKTFVYAVTRLDGDAEPPARESLGDRDEQQWRVSKYNGRRMDPWPWIAVLPLIDPKTGESLVFVAEGPSHDATSALSDALALRDDGDPKVPRIVLASHSTVNAGGKRWHYPIFRISGWEERPADTRHLQPPPLPLLSSAEDQAELALDAGAIPLRTNGRAPSATADDDIPF
jgi:hypothetical protein